MDIKESLFTLFKYCEYNFDEGPELFNMYMQVLSQYNKDFIVQRLKDLVVLFDKRYKGHVPSIKEILEPLTQIDSSQANRRFRELFSGNEEWAIDFKKDNLHFYRKAADSKENDPFILKEFTEIYGEWMRKKLARTNGGYLCGDYEGAIGKILGTSGGQKAIKGGSR